MSWFSDFVDQWTLNKSYKWGKGLANTKLLVFQTFQAQFPDMPVKELYYLTILNSPRFTLDDAKYIIEGPDEEQLASYNVIKIPFPDEEPLCLRSIVKGMLRRDRSQYFFRKGTQHPLNYYEACKAVDEIIPADL